MVSHGCVEQRPAAQAHLLGASSGRSSGPVRQSMLCSIYVCQTEYERNFLLLETYVRTALEVGRYVFAVECGCCTAIACD